MNIVRLMFPSASRDECLNGCVGDTELTSQCVKRVLSIPRLVKRPNLLSLFPSQFTFLSSLSGHIFHVLGRITEEKMFRIYASWIVACVQDPGSFWNITIMKNPTCDMGVGRFTIRPTQVDSAIAFKRATLPKPAGRSFHYPFPEAFRQRVSAAIVVITRCGGVWRGHNQVTVDCDVSHRWFNSVATSPRLSISGTSINPFS